MPVEMITPRPSSSSSKDLSSAECFSTHSGQEREASSRLAARLERSEFKRSRGKQRLPHQSSPNGLSTPRDKRHHRDYGEDIDHEAHFSRTKEVRHEDQTRAAESRDTTSLKTRRNKRHNDSPAYSRPRPLSWCEPTRNEEVVEERPKSVHILSFDRNLYADRVGGFTRGSHRRPRHNDESYQIVNDYSDTLDGESRNRVGESRDRVGESRNRIGERRNRVGESRNRVGSAKGEQYILRSRSSSFSSHVGSSADEQDDHHGVYSAYDMTGRSPYGSVVNRRYSQSSLSSSSASWQPSSAVVKVFRESGTLLSSPPDESREASSFFSPQPESRDHMDSSGYHDSSDVVYVGRGIQNKTQGNPQSSFSSKFAIHSDENSKQWHVKSENCDNVTPVYASRVVIGVGKATAESAQGTIVTLRNKDSSIGVPSVRDLAKRFSGRFSSLELSQDGYSTEDMRIVKAETWPKYAYVQTASDQYSYDEDSEIVPPKPPYPPSPIEHVLPRGADQGAPPKPPLPLDSSDRALPTAVSKQTRHNEVEVRSRKISDSRESKSNVCAEMFMHSTNEQQCTVSLRDSPRSETSSYGELKNSDIAVSQLIKLHEDRIASHAKSAFATSHLQIRLKRPPVECGPWWKGPERSPDSLKNNQEQEYVYRCVEEVDNVESPAAQTQKPFAGDENRKYVARYEVTAEVKHDRVKPIKIVEVTNKNDEASERQRVKERPTGRIKRHRTIGVVGYRQQIDRTAEEKAETKPKRHTAIGIVTVKAAGPKEKPVVSSDHIEHGEVDSFEVVPSPVKLELNEKDLESLEDSVFVEPSVEKDYQRDSRLLSKEVGREQTSFHEDAEAREEHSSSFGMSSRDVVLGRADDAEQSQEPTVAVFVQSTKEEESIPVIDVEVKVSESVCYSQSSQPRLNFSSRSFYHSKAVPIAQVSPVSPSATESERKTVKVTSPLRASHSAREMYETRLALWNLIPSASAQESYELQSPEAVRTASSAKRTPELPATNVSDGDSKNRTSAMNDDNSSLDRQRQEYYLKIVARLNMEKQEAIEKHESDKREWQQKYEEQKKVANAYQKLEDRYRRRVHELQDALANCICQNPLVVTDNTPHIARNKNDKLAKSSTSSSKGLQIVEELQDWLSEQSKNAEPAKGNNTTSGDSLISSSSDMTGMAWDEVYDLMVRNGEIDHVNGTHV